MFWHDSDVVRLVSVCRMHPHHHGSSTLQTQSASVPLVIDQNSATGFDFLATPSCERFRPLFAPENEVIMHMQVCAYPPYPPTPL